MALAVATTLMRALAPHYGRFTPKDGTELGAWAASTVMGRSW
jgi:hypothetical protein